MKFTSDRQRKAVMVKFSQPCCERLRILSGSDSLNKSNISERRPSDLIGMLGEKIAEGVVRTFPGERPRGVSGLYPERHPDQPALDRIVENLVIDAYPDGGTVNDYGEAFAEGIAKEWVDMADGRIDGRLDGKRLPRAR